MSYYSVETWTIKEVANAFKFENGDSQNRKVIIPIFQRGLRWDDSRRKSFIDSLNRGFPFGSLLFARHDNDANLYSVVDGLQRGSTVCDYVFNPLGKNNITKIEDDVLNKIRLFLFPGNQTVAINKEIEDRILHYFFDKKSFDDIDLGDLANILYDEFTSPEEFRNCTTNIKEVLKELIKQRKKEYENVCSSPVPIVVYSGPQELLSEIFNRINVKGITLNKYEIFAATWSQSKKVVNTTEIINKVIDKYLVLSRDYTIEGFDATKLLAEKELTAFEYLFGLGKYWTEKYDCLKIDSKSKKEDIVNEISFEIVDACINNSNNLARLDNILFKYNINKLQRRIEEAIDFVSKSIAVVSEFKGNNRKFKALHSKYQIISLISYTFREMYDIDNLDSKKASWDSNATKFANIILQYYVADILDNEWHDGGGNKVYTAINEKRYTDLITKQRWESLLDSYYQKQLASKQSERFTNPTNADSIILNCIYSNLFSANDQLSSKSFDIEHLATKEKMKELIKRFDNLKLPVSCIANLCYLPEDINRGKKDKTIYEANNLSMSVQDIEEKFSFTKKNDFEWLYYPYDDNDSRLLEEYYSNYLDNRYKEIKKRFLFMFGY